MLIELDFESDTPIYEQLKNEIIVGIAKKELLPGERLPSVRNLASDISVNLHTVNKAYKQLQQEGFLLIHRQRGVVVNPDGPPIADEKYMKLCKEIVRPLMAEAICRGVSKDELLIFLKSIYNEFSREDQNE